MIYHVHFIYVSFYVIYIIYHLYICTQTYIIVHFEMLITCMLHNYDITQQEAIKRSINEVIYIQFKRIYKPMQF